MMERPGTVVEMRLLDASRGDCNKRVWLGGVDVSDLCDRALVPARPGVEAEGKVRLYKLRDGKRYLEDGEVACEWRQGIVKWELCSP